MPTPSSETQQLLRDLQDENARLKRELASAVADAYDQYDQGYADAEADCADDA